MNKYNGIKLTSSMEDYLETINLLEAKQGVARVTDISETLNVKKPSVTSAINNLSEKGLITHAKYGYIKCTIEGKKIAKDIQKKHNTLSRFLSGILGVSSRLAAEDACKLEHSISSKTFERLTKFVDFVDNCPKGNKPGWLKNFEYYVKTGKRKNVTN